MTPRVLVVSNMSPKPSAPLLGQFVDNQVEALKDAGCDVDYVKPNWNGDGLLFKLFRYPVFLLQFLFAVVFRRTQYDVIHVHYYYPTILIAITYRWFVSRKTKFVVTCHGSDIYLYENPGWLYKKLSNHIHCWIFTSSALKERFYRKVGSSKVWSAGFNNKIFNCQSHPDKSSERKYLACMICHLDTNKGIDRLLDIVQRLPEHKFALIGTGPLLQKVKQFSTQHSNLEVLGALKSQAVKQVITQSKACLSLSRNESFGLTISEAQACGTPVFATETDGSKEQLQDTYRLVPQSNDELELCNSFVEKLLTLNSLSDSAFVKLSDKVIEETTAFSLTSIAENLKELYVQLANEVKKK
ncbi:glycosyltransferase family 4 protein [Pseudoalteromonas pernae]|uniref:glycosyltransferase family 4 protein n=1 Tax=Pseudoalteromonas pernae TaxID=3118054 RepID=UPI003242878D